MFINIRAWLIHERKRGSRPTGTHLVLYDGVCGLCSRLLQFLLAHDHRARVQVRLAAERDGTGDGGARAAASPQALSSFYVVANYRTPEARAFTRSRAALFVAGQLGWPWTAARLARRPAESAARSRVRPRRAEPVSRLRPLRSVPRCRVLSIAAGSSTEFEGAMKIVIPGGSGQVGTILARAFHARRS